MTQVVPLRSLAFARAGDKGDISNVCVVARHASLWDAVRDQVTTDRVAEAYGDLVRGRIDRYELPKVHALNFVMHAALRGGVTRSLGLDGHGKTRSSVMLTMQVEIPDDMMPWLESGNETGQ